MKKFLMVFLFFFPLTSFAYIETGVSDVYNLDLGEDWAKESTTQDSVGLFYIGGGKGTGANVHITEYIGYKNLTRERIKDILKNKLTHSKNFGNIVAIKLSESKKVGFLIEENEYRGFKHQSAIYWNDNSVIIVSFDDFDKYSDLYKKLLYKFSFTENTQIIEKKEAELEKKQNDESSISGEQLRNRWLIVIVLLLFIAFKTKFFYIKTLLRKMKGFRFERKFENIAKDEDLLVEYVEQSKKSIKKFKKEGNRKVKRPDFLLLSSVEKIYFELKCYTVYSDSFFKFSYKEMKGLARFKKQTNAKEIYILFLDQRKEIKKENILTISLSDLEKLVDIKDQKIPVIERNTLCIYLKYLVKFDFVLEKM